MHLTLRSEKSGYKIIYVIFLTLQIKKKTGRKYNKIFTVGYIWTIELWIFPIFFSTFQM